MKEHIKIALVGQPNVGKTMLINAIGKSALHVGNFSGVTVEKEEITFEYKDFIIDVVDLPGTYMLSEYSLDEKVTSNFLREEEYDIILNVVDATNLDRNLQLTSELIQLDKKMIIALNMIDEAKKENIEINSNYMSELLKIDCIKISASTKEGLDQLLATIVKTHSMKQMEPKFVFSEDMEEEIREIVQCLEEHQYPKSLSHRYIAIGLISENSEIYKQLHDKPIWIYLEPLLLKAHKHIKIHHDENAMLDIMANEYKAYIDGLLSLTIKIPKKIEELTVTQKIDKVLIHPILGIPIFLSFMWLLFQLTFEIGSIPMDYIDAFFGYLGDTLGATISNDELRSLVVDGLIGGVGAVVLFVPNIMILYVGIALLESTGYMSRVAYLLDGFFHKFGLHGQSFIPLVTGFGCSIPAYMSARILKNDRDRLLTLFIIGFMSCGARLPVYVLFVGAFFAPEMAGNVLFTIYMGGALLGLVMAKILKLTVFKGESEPFVMEMPKYRMPSVMLIWHTVKTKTWLYLKKAGTFIAVASMLVWFGSNYPKNLELTEKYEQMIVKTEDKSKKVELTNQLNEELLKQSYLGEIGQAIEPLFEPLGMDWKMAVALQTGLAAKEVVVSTLGVLYSLGDEVDEESSSLIQRLQEDIPFASAVAFIIIMMIYLPCLAATIVFAKEAGGKKYALYLFIFTSTVAYLLAFIGYHLAL